MQFLSFLNNLIFQQLCQIQYCVLCGSSCKQQICESCYISIQPQQQIDRNRCHRCLIERAPRQLDCDNCKQNQFAFSRIISAYDYKFPLECILHKVKYTSNLEYTTLLSQLFWSRIQKQISILPDAIIPVPLHRNKHKLRGFNQVHEIIREFKYLHPEVKIINAQRIKETKQQANLNRTERVANLKNVFTISEILFNKQIVIVDDVVTTGSTVNELARLCKHLGARDVQVWCLMRAQS